MNKFLFTAILTASTVAAMGRDSAAGFATLGTAGSYNEFILGDSTRSNVDSQGRVAVGGNASFTNFTVADVSVDPNNVDGLVVGGKLDVTNGSQVGHGSVEVGGAYTLHSGSLMISHGSLTTNVGASNLPVDFSAEGTYLKSLSQAQYSAADPTVAAQYGGLTFAASGPGASFFNVTAASFSGANTYNITGNAGETVVINVLHDANQDPINFQNAGVNLSGGITADHVLFNFVGFTGTLNISGIGVQGSILAPLASVAFGNGHIDGNLIAGSLSGSGETHVIAGGGFLRPVGPVRRAAPQHRGAGAGLGGPDGPGRRGRGPAGPPPPPRRLIATRSASSSAPGSSTMPSAIPGPRH